MTSQLFGSNVSKRAGAGRKVKGRNVQITCEDINRACLREARNVSFTPWPQTAMLAMSSFDRAFEGVRQKCAPSATSSGSSSLQFVTSEVFE